MAGEPQDNRGQRATDQERHDLEIKFKKEKAERRKPKPPPAPCEVFAAAQRHYDETIRALEASGLGPAVIEAGRKRAKQKFLEAIDGVI